MSTYITRGDTRPLGYVQDTTVAAAQALPSIPYGARLAVIRTEGQAIRWRDDGVNPTSTVGMPLLVSEELHYDGDLTAIRIIEQAASASVSVAYYE